MQYKKKFLSVTLYIDVRARLLYCYLMIKQQSISLSDGNAKLVKTSGEAYKVIGFGIPADLAFNGMNTCRGAGACRAVCYAKAGAYLFPNVASAKRANLDATLSDTFTADMVAALRRRRSYNTVRIHDAGDFYSQEYFAKWCAVARALPGHKFYAYTKALDIDLWIDKPDNFQVVQSLGGQFDRLVDLNRSHSRIFASEAARLAAGYVDGNVNDIPAIEGVTRIGLVYHGVRKLTLPQVRYFG